MNEKNMSRITNPLLIAILILLVINLVVSLALFSRQPVAAVAETVDAAIAREWGEKVAVLYNQQDDLALYALFNQQAQVKISQQQLTGQLHKLHQLFGNIESQAYLNSVKLGSKGSEFYYQLFFNLRVSKNSQPATMKLSLVFEDSQISLYGLRINAEQSLE
jgi:hypothetical protein